MNETPPPTCEPGSRLAPAPQGSVLVIKPSASLGCTDCVKERRRSDGSLLLRVPTGLRDRQLLALLRPYEGYRVWRLSYRAVKAPGQAFSGFTCAGSWLGSPPGLPCISLAACQPCCGSWSCVMGSRPAGLLRRAATLHRRRLGIVLVGSAGMEAPTSPGECAFHVGCL
jgi:hypothetical protein